MIHTENLPLCPRFCRAAHLFTFHQDLFLRQPPQSCYRQLPGGKRGKDSVFIFLPRCVFLLWGSLLRKVKTEFCHCHGEKRQPMEGAGPCQGRCLPLGGQDRMLSSLALPPARESRPLPQRAHYRHLDCGPWQMEGGTVTKA